MKKVLFFLTCLGIFDTAVQAQQNNEIALLIAPLKLDDQSSYQLLYRKSLKKENWKLRVGLRLLIDTDKEIRADTVFNNVGTVQYDISAGLQRNLAIDGLENLKGYVALDGYWNSDFRQTSANDYYGYFWNFGVRPTLGISYEPCNNIRVSIESRANFNVNLQDYNAKGKNSDQRYIFSLVDHLAFGLGYLF